MFQQEISFFPFLKQEITLFQNKMSENQTKIQQLTLEKQEMNHQNQQILFEKQHLKISTHHHYHHHYQRKRRRGRRRKKKNNNHKQPP